jgi:glycosyltransferase involved in cell wall biosynthesis
MNMTVSVIIPCTDRTVGLRRCLESAINQDYRGELEVILVENNSQDRTLVSALVSSMDNVNIKHYYLDRCTNANIARNYGADKSSGKYIAFLDSDDWWESEHLQDCYGEILRSGAMALYSGFKLHNGLNIKVIISRAIQKCESGCDFLFSKNAAHAQTSSYFINKEVFKLCRWDESLKRNQDYDFFIRVQSNFTWAFKDKLSVNVFWPVGMARTYSADAFEIFYDKHRAEMSSENKAFYLYEILRALSFVGKHDYNKFLLEASKYRVHLGFVKKLQTYNYSITVLIGKARDLVRKFLVR